MAEYIEREALKRDLIDNRGFYPSIVKSAIENAPTADVVEVDKFASKIAGHSYYHGDKILARLYCLKEGQKIEKSIEPADVVEVDKVAEMLRIMFDDDCACNYNGNDEWLPMHCKHVEECPMPKERLGCWKEFVKHFLAKMDGKGDEHGV